MYTRGALPLCKKLKTTYNRVSFSKFLCNPGKQLPILHLSIFLGLSPKQGRDGIVGNVPLCRLLIE
jgi:hypothetical protein